MIRTPGSFCYYPYAPGAYLPEGTRLILLTDSSEEVTLSGRRWHCRDPARACATLVDLLPKATRKLQPLKSLPAPEVKDKITADYVYYTVAKLRPKNSVITQESASSAPQSLAPTALGTQILLLLVQWSSWLWVASGLRCRPGRTRSRHESQGRLAGRAMVRRITSFSILECGRSRNCPFCSSSFAITNKTSQVVRRISGHPQCSSIRSSRNIHCELARGYGCDGNYVSKPGEAGRDRNQKGVWSRRPLRGSGRNRPRNASAPWQSRSKDHSLCYRVASGTTTSMDYMLEKHTHRKTLLL